MVCSVAVSKINIVKFTRECLCWSPFSVKVQEKQVEVTEKWVDTMFIKMFELLDCFLPLGFFFAF